jgi:hypothetical protein
MLGLALTGATARIIGGVKKNYDEKKIKEEEAIKNSYNVIENIKKHYEEEEKELINNNHIIELNNEKIENIKQKIHEYENSDTSINQKNTYLEETNIKNDKNQIEELEKINLSLKNKNLNIEDSFKKETLLIMEEVFKISIGKKISFVKTQEEFNKGMEKLLSKNAQKTQNEIKNFITTYIQQIFDFIKNKYGISELNFYEKLTAYNKDKFLATLDLIYNEGEINNSNRVVTLSEYKYFLENCCHFLDEKDVSIDFIKKIFFILENDKNLAINNTEKSLVYENLQKNLEKMEEKMDFILRIFEIYYMVTYIKKNGIEPSIKSGPLIHFTIKYFTEYKNEDLLEINFNNLAFMQKLQKFMGVEKNIWLSFEKKFNLPEVVLENIQKIIKDRSSKKIKNNQNNNIDIGGLANNIGVIEAIVNRAGNVVLV